MNCCLPPGISSNIVFYNSFFIFECPLKVEARPGLGPGQSSSFAACPPVLAANSNGAKRLKFLSVMDRVEVRPGLGPGRSSTIAACPPIKAAIWMLSFVTNARFSEANRLLRIPEETIVWRSPARTRSRPVLYYCCLPPGISSNFRKSKSQRKYLYPGVSILN